MAEFLTSGNAIVLILLIIAIAVSWSSFAVAQENERFAVFMMGRFVRYAGPGIVLKSPAMRLVRLKVGDIGSVVSREFARFGDDDIPVGSPDSMAIGDPVRIDTFDDAGPRLARSALRPKTRCPECGHEF